jgi:calpain family cysteine protease
MPDLTLGVINPYALAEVILKRRVRWERLSDPDEFLQVALQKPWKELFDPKFKSPLYPRVEVRDQTLSIASRDELDRALTRITFQDIRSTRYARVLGQVNKDSVLSALKVEAASGNNAPWQPADTEWIDMGDFFEEGTEGGDPVQGALADCYHIAALGAVAWARPYQIVHRNRRTGGGQEEFVDEVTYTDTNNGQEIKQEVTERVPVTQGSHNFRYARSSETGEIWPTVYEKAYAKWKSGNTTDQPDYTAIEYGDCVQATAELIGGQQHYESTGSNSANDLGVVKK